MLAWIFYFFSDRPSVESLLPTLDLDSLKDPADFFMAHERLESKSLLVSHFSSCGWHCNLCDLFLSYWVCIWWIDAKREIQKQLGGASFESDQDKAAARPRQRRPGLLGNDQLYPHNTLIISLHCAACDVWCCFFLLLNLVLMLYGSGQSSTSIGIQKKPQMMFCPLKRH